MTNETHTAHGNLNIDEARGFVEKAAFTFTPERRKELETLQASTFRCIDDRASLAPHVEGQDIAIPGAGLSILMDTLTVVRKLELGCTPKEVMECVEGIVGTLSYHTDEKHENDELICAGCGHCAGMLDDPEAYDLGDEAIVFLLDYFPKLEGYEKPTVYPGDHNARAVFVVDSRDIGLSSTDGDNLAFVYHAKWHEYIISGVSRALAEKADTDESEVRRVLWEITQKRLAVTTQKLASHLPVYTVTHDEGEISVRKS